VLLIFLLIACCFLAYSNGANDNFKGVATLFGSNTTHFKKAINWATATTFLGSVAAIFLAQELVKNFSGKGLVSPELVQAPEFATSIALGAALTVFIATKIGMPISTTHSLVGGLFGSGVIAVGSAFNFTKLGSTFFMPLLISPLMAAVLSLVAYLIFRKLRKSMGVTKETCICIGDELQPVTKISTADNFLADVTTVEKTVKVGLQQECTEVYQGAFLGFKAQQLLDSAHYISAGVVSFARGLNDTPKIMGLLLVVSFLDIEWGMVIIAIAIAFGGLLNSRKVGETVSKKITPMNHGQGFTANLITGLLVTTASIHGMPVSTTHVSVGSIFGIGMITKKTNVKTILKILFSWLLTLPVAACLSAFTYWVLAVLF